MMRTGTLRQQLVIVCCAVWCFAAEGATVRISLRDTVDVDVTLVRLGDIATLEPIAHDNGSEGAQEQVHAVQLIDRLQTLDLAELTATRKSITLHRQQVAIRIRLAGIDLDDVELRGARQTRVAMVNPLSDDRIAEAVRGAIAEYLSLPAADIVFEPTATVNVPSDLPTDVPLTLRVILPTPTRLDQLRVSLGLYHEERLVRSVAISGTTKVLKPTLLATERIAVGTAITKRNTEIKSIPRLLTDEVVSDLRIQHDPRELIGTFAAQPIQVGQSVLTSNTSLSVDTNRPIIAPRDRVRMVAQGKGLTVTLTDAEALEKGRVGDSIRVRNPHSGRIIVGRIQANGDVTVTY